MQLEEVQGQITKVGDDIKKFVKNQNIAKACSAALTDADAAAIELIQRRWDHYTLNNTDGPRFAAMNALKSIQSGSMPNPPPADIYDPWATEVLDELGVSVEAALSILQKRLLVGAANGAVDGVIKTCAVWYLTKFQDNPDMMFSFDDRQYFSPINNLVRYYTNWMARGLHMIQEAWLFRAQMRALSAWRANQALSGCNMTSSSKCNFDAQQLPTSGGSSFCAQLQASQAAKRLTDNYERALTACERFDQATKKITDYAYELQKYAGIPYSWGGKGEGVRLVLGSDITGRNATIAFGTPASRVILNQSTRTEWLVAASSTAFCGSTCSKINSSGLPDVPGFYEPPRPKLNGQILAGPLSGPPQFLISYFPREVTLGLGYPLGYEADLWEPAGDDVWNFGLRGMSRNQFDTSSGGKGTTRDGGPLSGQQFIEQMEKGAEWLGAVPFSNISDRQWVSISRESGKRGAVLLLLPRRSVDSDFFPFFFFSPCFLTGRDRRSPALFSPSLLSCPLFTKPVGRGHVRHIRRHILSITR